jgi:transglutaminase-like putative cysteine protease
VLPVASAITVTALVLSLLMLTGVARIAERSGTFGGSGGLGSAAGGRSASDYLGGDMDLNTRGSLTSDPVFQVPASSPRLWRAGTLDQYTGRGWVASVPATGLPRLARQKGAVVVVPPPTSAGRIRTDRVHPLRGGLTQILAPGELAGFESPVLAGGGTAFVTAGDRVTMNGASDDGSADYTVRTEVLPLVGDPVSLGGESDGADPRDARWTTLPTTVPTRVRQLGVSLVRAAPSRAAAVRSIEAELARRMTYRLDSPVPPPGADTVDDVLFESHSGFCEQFATAAVVLLRSAGVPARVAVGFAGGEPDTSGHRTMRRSDAHAWVEVWLPGLGWATSDPTPASVEQESWWQSWWKEIRTTLLSLLTRPLTWVIGAGVLVLALVIGLLAVRRSRRRRAAEARAALTVDADLAAAFERLEVALRESGRPRAPSETVSALAGRLRMERLRAGPLQRETDISDALEVLERALYAAAAPSREECLAAAAAMDRRLEGSSS